MGFFSNKRTESATQSVKPVTTIAPNHVSKKLKNTYTVKFSPFCDTGLFCLCKTTPLAVIKLNGQTTQPSDGWLSCTMFPNPYASEMQAAYQDMAKFDEKTATTIIEYLDMSSGKPVLYIFPTGMHIIDEYKNDYATHLNHATRRDIARQIKLRQKLLAQMNQNQQ